MDRRQLIKGIGAAICAGLTPTFVPDLISEPKKLYVYLNGSTAKLSLFASETFDPNKALMAIWSQDGKHEYQEKRTYGIEVS